MERSEFDLKYNFRIQIKRFGCKSCKYYNVVRNIKGMINGKCMKMDEMEIKDTSVNALKGCDLFEYDLLKPIDNSLKTIKTLVIILFAVIMFGWFILWTVLMAMG